MMFRRRFLIPALLGLFGIGASMVVAGTAVSLEGVKCLMVAKKDANKDKFSKWKEGKVFFCCDGCRGKFEKLDKEGKEKIATKANHQLVATKQYEQKGCPFSGGEIDESTKIEVAGASIAFCCTNCKGKAEKMEKDKQLEALFGEKAFKTAKFTPPKN